MILPFSTQLNGKLTYFVEKIWQGLKKNDMLFPGASLETTDRRYFEYYGESPFDYTRMFIPKIHTIREDKNNRWKAGIKIDFFINCRQKNMFRFAPVLPVISTQEIRIKYTMSSSNTPLVYVEVFGNNDWKCLGTYNPKNKEYFGDLLLLAQNDGFDTVEDFFLYFNKNFKGKIIHWTDLKY